MNELGERQVCEILERVALWSPRLHRNERYREFLPRLPERDLSVIHELTLERLSWRAEPVPHVSVTWSKPRNDDNAPCVHGHIGAFVRSRGRRWCRICARIRNRLRWARERHGRRKMVAPLEMAG